LINCSLVSNSTPYVAGGALAGALTNCIITGNAAGEDGGGTLGATLVNCIVSSNSAAAVGGGMLDGSGYNCLFVGNSAQEAGAAFGPSLNNCTIVFNTATTSRGGGAEDCSMSNCIIYFNTAPNGSNYYGSYVHPLNYCCTTPLPDGNGNFTNAPLFVDVAAGNFHLQSNSPCINSGLNADAPAGPDLDGNARIAGGTVDLGAYEFQSPQSVISYAWLQNYGLPTDGSSDFADSDGDGMNNWGEWRCDTIPTNALSVLRMLSTTLNPSGVNVSWQSVPTRSYSLQRAATLGVVSPFQTIANNLPGIAGVRSYTDASATNANAYFYRVVVQQ